MYQARCFSFDFSPGFSLGALAGCCGNILSVTAFFLGFF
jgi:hypothetical protein